MGHYRKARLLGDKRSPEVAIRLLTKSKAAAYCGMSLASFGRLVQALRFSERLVRFDRFNIDARIDALKGPARIAGTDWLEVGERANSKG
jgi:hypothetical protein